MKIIAVVVTYNRCQLLERCLDYLERQTRLPNHVLVINHSSTDGTLEMLKTRHTHVITQENQGSSAGWYRGIEYALLEEFDAVWLMDDDGFPDINALAFLEQELTPGRSCVSSVVMQENNHNFFVFPFPKLNANNLPVLFARKRKIDSWHELKKITPSGLYPFAHFFNGALISTNAIRSIGNVNKEYFIYGEEVDYLCRLKKLSDVLSVLNAIHYHPNVALRPYTRMKMYFNLRNTLVLNQRYFDWVWLRHGTTILAVLWRTFKRNGIADLMRLLRCSVFYKALFRGIRGELGHDFD